MNNIALMLLLAVAFLMQSCWELAFELGPEDPYRPHALRLSPDISSHNVLDLNINPDPAPNCFVPMLRSYHTAKWCNQGCATGIGETTVRTGGIVPLQTFYMEDSQAYAVLWYAVYWVPLTPDPW
jgi:hypothetical protein